MSFAHIAQALSAWSCSSGHLPRARSRLRPGSARYSTRSADWAWTDLSTGKPVQFRPGEILCEASAPLRPAFSSTSKIPKVFPSVSTKYPCQHLPGTQNFGERDDSAKPQYFRRLSIEMSTSKEHTKAFVPHCAGGRSPGRLSKPPSEPLPVSMCRYGMDRPSTSENFQPNTAL